jgi:hypothetical protein
MAYSIDESTCGKTEKNLKKSGEKKKKKKERKKKKRKKKKNRQTYTRTPRSYCNCPRNRVLKREGVVCRRIRRVEVGEVLIAREERGKGGEGHKSRLFYNWEGTISGKKLILNYPSPSSVFISLSSSLAGNKEKYKKI